MVIITVKLSRGHAGQHDPKNKITGPCPLGGGGGGAGNCTDVTGEHHSFLADNEEVGLAFAKMHGWTHITRVEEV